MIFVLAKVFLKPLSADVFIKIAHHLIEKSRVEKGCLSYDLARLDENTLYFIES